MVDRHTIRHPGPRSVAVVSPHVALAAMVSIAATPILLAFVLVPRIAVLPAISFAALAMAAVAALAAWLRRAPRHGVKVTLWDVAGALVLIGCAAAMLTEAEHLVELFGSKPPL
jgi:hypothetical protein